ncbi:hypothetical protein H0G86_006479 [Trichoderma simmonsii]|uniref:Uncharacterized protein n=1 Tax=Trichoderma simmonsii TaxID=1491479 RepID=A0A8G0LDK1_9HYPO|nr:hypothetical protein H0G86_006479 [Trichoderma simmonsii]
MSSRSFNLEDPGDPEQQKRLDDGEGSGSDSALVGTELFIQRPNCAAPNRTKRSRWEAFLSWLRDSQRRREAIVVAEEIEREDQNPGALAGVELH